MKKNFFLGLIALTALTVTSCSNDDVVEAVPQNQAIEFGTYLGRDAEARASILTNDELKTKGFGVFAYYTEKENFDASKHTEANFMNNTQVTYPSSKWEYKPLKYWPNNTGDKVSFFAYAPYNSGYSLNSSSLTFTVNPNVKDQVDLTWNAGTTSTINMTKANIDDDPVTFTFKHALSKIGFTIQAATDEVNVGSNKLDENTVINVKRVILSGSEVEFVSPSTYNTNSIFTKTATLDLNNFNTTTASWTDRTGDQFYTLTEDNFNVKQLTNTNSTTLNQLNTNDSYLMIIPQDLSSTGFNVFIEYDVVTTSTGGTDDSTITNRINKKVTGINFQSGNAYTLNLVLGMTSVELSASMYNWNDPSSTKVDLPINTTK